MASKNKSRLKSVTSKAGGSRVSLCAKQTPHRPTSSSEDSGADNDLDVDVRKLKMDRKRKADNQHRYYYRQVNTSGRDIFSLLTELTSP